MENSPKPSVVLGYNHNIKHQGNIFHVQTEDSGTKNPHIMTHLFVGGNIIATKKTSYADIVHAENLEEIVRELMQEQHKTMLRNLINGTYDAIYAQRFGRSDPKNPREAKPAPVTAKPSAHPPQQSSARPKTPAQTEASRFPAAQQSFKQKVGSRPGPETTQTGGKFAPVAPSARKAATDIDTDKPAVNQTQDTNQPSDRCVEKDPTEATIFGEKLITEKSLDEVILGYLSGDADEKG